MKILQMFSNFYGKYKNLLDLKFPEISQWKLSNFSENDFRKVGEKTKYKKVRKKLEFEESPF